MIAWAFWDGKMTLVESGSLLVVYIIYVFFVAKWATWLNYEKTPLEASPSENKIEEISRARPYLFFGISIIVIAALSHFMVESAVHIAHFFHVSEVIIGLTVLAAGTSIPDLISSVIVAKDGK